MANFSFFGKVDENSKGLVGSEYPAWTMRTHMSELEESIRQKESAIKMGLVDPANLAYHKELLNKEKGRLGDIKNSKPQLTDPQKTKVAESYTKLTNYIAETLFTRSDMKLGLADAHEEARRMTMPIISVDKSMAKACNVKVFGDKVTRNGAIKMFKIMGHYLNAQTNAEALRKEA